MAYAPRRTARLGVEAGTPVTLTVATYNVHRCVGHDGRHDAGRVLEVLRELDADVIALQELEWQPEAARDLLAHFAGTLGSQAIAGPTLLAGTGTYGNAVLTRLPVRAVRRVDLSVSGREPRGALDLTLEAPTSPLRVIATHLGLAPVERRQQIRRILTLLPTTGDEPVVLMGDLNEWFLWGRPLRWLRTRFGQVPAPATFPARIPIFALDRIWVQPRSLCRSIAAYASTQAREASDHLPLRVTLAWPHAHTRSDRHAE